jgi:hypothetical protein
VVLMHQSSAVQQDSEGFVGDLWLSNIHYVVSDLSVKQQWMARQFSRLLHQYMLWMASSPQAATHTRLSLLMLDLKKPAQNILKLSLLILSVKSLYQNILKLAHPDSSSK